MVRFMVRAIQFAKIIALLSLSVLLLVAARVVWQAPALLNSQATALISTLDNRIMVEVNATRKPLMKRIDTALTLSNRQASLARRDLTVDIFNLQQTIDARLSSIEGKADAQLTGARTDLTSDLLSLRSDIKPSIDGLNLLMARNALPAQLLGLTAAAKVTAGETAQAAKAFQIALPSMLTTLQSIGDNTRAGTEQYKKVAEDTDIFIKRMTPPYLPKWARLAVAIAGPAAQTGAAVVGAGAALGAFNK